jgi:hypothetical protein
VNSTVPTFITFDGEIICENEKFEEIPVLDVICSDCPAAAGFQTLWESPAIWVPIKINYTYTHQ